MLALFRLTFLCSIKSNLSSKTVVDAYISSLNTSSRVERALNFTIAYQLSKSVSSFQKCSLCCGMNYNYKMVGGNNNKRTAERKIQKSSASLWRPVSVQACSSDVKDVDVNIEVKSEIEVHAGSSSGVLKSQDSHYRAKLGTKLAEPNIGSTDKHSISMEVGHSLFRFIKGKGGSMQEKIEEEMGIRIIFPSSRMEESLIIEGSSPDSVARASERIQLIIDEAVKSPALDYSHFISLPLAIHPQLVDKLFNFQNTILGVNNANPNEVLASTSNRDAKELGIDKSIFINPKTFHLTVLMLKLWNKDRVDAAVRIFKGIEAEVLNALEGQPVSIKLKGLDTMRGSFAKAGVLYAPVEVVGGEDRLLKACKVITDAFMKGGLVLEKDAKRTLKLHATVMNVRHRKRKNYTRKFDSFDARDIMERYGSEEWGEYPIPEVHLSQRFVYDENGYYHRCSSFPLPKNLQAH